MGDLLAPTPKVHRLHLFGGLALQTGSLDQQRGNALVAEIQEATIGMVNDGYYIIRENEMSCGSSHHPFVHRV